MTSIAIRVTRPRSEVGEIKLDRSQLVKGTEARAGTFTIGAGEIVYIGNFKIDCKPPMTLWRYYTEGSDG